MFYRFCIRPLLYLLPAETAHHFAFYWLRLIGLIPGMLNAIRAVMHVDSPALETRVFGRVLPNPIGLAAGFDKDAVAFEILGALGFGFVEIGTLTAQGQQGNDKPRLFRLVSDRALINRMGFNNLGAQNAVRRLRQPRKHNDRREHRQDQGCCRITSHRRLHPKRRASRIGR